MKCFQAVFTAFLISCSASAVCAEVLIKPNDTNINYYGRFDFSGASTSVKFNWPGSVIEARFPGPSIGVEMNDGDTNYFNVEIDGVIVDSLKFSSITHRTIRTNLSATADHTIRITLRTNGVKICSFGGLYLADGKSLAARPVQPTRKMEFIGDSWTAADVVGAPLGRTDYALKDFNATLSYARLTSIAYHAQDKLIARGGCGLVKSNNGEATMLARYPKILCDGAANWDFTSWIPDVVVIFMGINDYNNGVTEAAFKTAYTSLINAVRGHYPNVPIILANLADRMPTSIPTFAQSFTKTYTFAIPFTLMQAKAEYWHPDASQHRQIANALIPVVKQAAGWDTTAPVTAVTANPGPEKHLRVFKTSRIMKTSRDIIDFGPELFGMEKEIVVYDCSGRLARKLATRKQTVSLKKDIGLSEGFYIVKTATSYGKSISAMPPSGISGSLSRRL